MLKIYAYERDNFKAMKDKDWLNESINYHMKVLKQRTDKLKIMRLLQIMGEHSVKTLGVSFLNNKSMAKLLSVSVRTIQRYTATLEALGVVIKVATLREENNSQTSNTYIIRPVINKACHGGCHPLKPSLKPSLKQDTNINLYNINNTNIINSVDELKAFRFLKLKLADRNVKHLSSYIEKMIQNHENYERKVIETEKRRQDRKERIHFLSQELNLLGNWLES